MADEKSKSTSKSSDEAGGEAEVLPTDWHKFQVPHEPVEGSGEGEDDKAEKLPEDECETCGLGADALVHQVDEAGNPTPEARFAVEHPEAG